MATVWVDVPWEAGGGHYDDGQGHVSYDGGNTWVSGGGGGAAVGGTSVATGAYEPYLGGWIKRKADGGYDWDTFTTKDPTASSTYTSGVDFDGSVTGVVGATYQKSPSGAISIISRPSTGGGSTTVHIAPADTTGAWSIQYDSNGNGFKINKITGEVVPLGFDKTPGSANYPGDANGDGLNDATGRANGVTSVPTSVSPTGFVYGTTPVWPNGTPYTGGTTGTKKADILVDKTGAITGRAGTSYYYDENGIPHTLVTGTAPSTSSSSGGSTSNAGTYSGSSGGGGGGSSTTGVRSGGYNNTDTTIHQGGFTNTNISDVGPGTMAENALDRAARASEFAATNALNRTEAQRRAAETYANLLSQVDPNAYQAFIDANGGGRLDNALLSGGNALSANAINPAAMALAASRGQEYNPNTGVTTPLGGLPSATSVGGGGPTSPGAAGGGLTQSGGSGEPATPAPASTDPYVANFGPVPAGYNSWIDVAKAWGAPPEVTGNAQGGGGYTPSAADLGKYLSDYFIQQRQLTDPAYAAAMNAWISGPTNEAQWRDYALSRLNAPQSGATYNPNAPGGGTVGYTKPIPGAYLGGGSSVPTGTVGTAATLSPGTTVTTGGGTGAAPAGNYPGTAGTGYGGSGLPEDVYYGAHGTDFTNPATGKTYPAYTVQPQAATNFQQPYPNLGKNPDGTPISPVQLPKAPHYDPATNTWVPTLAHGGLTRAPMMITGDPQRDGRPNPEIISNPTGAPISVMPMRNMGGLPQPNAMAMQHANMNARFMRQPMMRMGGLPRYAYGTDQQGVYDPYVPPTTVNPVQAQQQWSAPLDWIPTVQPPAPAPVTMAPASAASTPAPAVPVDTSTPSVGNGQLSAPADWTPTTQPSNNPAQIGDYSTAPGTAGQPVTTATTPPAPTTSPLEQPGNPLFNEVLYTRLAATNPWMANPTEFMNVDYPTRDPVARRLYEQYLTMKFGIPQESIDFAQARNRLGGASLASMGQGR